MDAADKRRISHPIDLAAYEAGDSEAMNRNSLGQSEYHIQPPVQPQEEAGSGYSNNQGGAIVPGERVSPTAPRCTHMCVLLPTANAAKEEEKGACKLCSVM